MPGQRLLFPRERKPTDLGDHQFDLHGFERNVWTAIGRILVKLYTDMYVLLLIMTDTNPCSAMFLDQNEIVINSIFTMAGLGLDCSFKKSPKALGLQCDL